MLISIIRNCSCNIKKLICLSLIEDVLKKGFYISLERNILVYRFLTKSCILSFRSGKRGAANFSGRILPSQKPNL